MIRYHNDKVTIELKYTESSKMIADMLTKILTKSGLQRMRAAVMKDAHVDVNDYH